MKKISGLLVGAAVVVALATPNANGMAVFGRLVGHAVKLSKNAWQATKNTGIALKTNRKVQAAGAVTALAGGAGVYKKDTVSGFVTKVSDVVAEKYNQIKTSFGN